MHPADIQAALRKSGSSQAAISRKQRVSQTLVYQVVHSRGRSKRVAKAISQATGISVRILWPGQYDDGRSAGK
jgi:lambda repressor-like predicted transcriptional regulator